MWPHHYDVVSSHFATEVIPNIVWSHIDRHFISAVSIHSTHCLETHRSSSNFLWCLFIPLIVWSPMDHHFISSSVCSLFGDSWIITLFPLMSGHSTHCLEPHRSPIYFLWCMLIVWSLVDHYFISSDVCSCHSLFGASYISTLFPLLVHSYGDGHSRGEWCHMVYTSFLYTRHNSSDL